MSASSSSSSSSSSQIDLRELLSVAIDLSERSGGIITSVFASGQLGAIEKDEKGSTSAGFSDPQTKADRDSQILIHSTLHKLYGSSLHIIGEEDLDGTQHLDAAITPARDTLNNYPFPDHVRYLDTNDLVVWIDPLDGTKEYTLGLKECVTVLIGITYRGRPIAGVIHVPFTGRTIWAAVGVGAFHSNPDKSSSSPRFIPFVRPEKRTKRVITTTRSHYTKQTEAFINSLKPDEVLRFGGAGAKAILVLDGIADAYVYPQTGTKRWDTAAIDAAIKAHGGSFTNAYGDEIDYSPNVDVNNNDGLTCSLSDHALYVIERPASASASSSSSSASKL